VGDAVRQPHADPNFRILRGRFRIRPENRVAQASNFRAKPHNPCWHRLCWLSRTGAPAEPIDMTTADKPLSIGELQRELVDRIYRFALRLRFVVAPLPIILGSIVLLFDHTLWRRTLIVLMLATATAMLVMRDARGPRLAPPNLARVALMIGGGIHPVILIATGGVLSPVILAMLLVDFVASTLLEPRVSRLLLRIQVLSIVTAAALEYTKIIGTLLPQPFRAVTGFTPSPALLLLWACLAVFMFSVTRELGLRIREAFSDLLLRTTRARDDTLRMHQEQLAELTQLSAESAHELKNPLASVKGLAALLARRHQGDEPEPLVVLRREVDRMQTILEEFLNYSRPLVPLNLEHADLAAISREVSALHAGMVEERDVSIAVDAPSALLVQCDPRKIRQILVNLLQNALQATPAHGSVSLQVTALDGCVAVYIDDSGTGLDPSIAPRVFEAGVTTKKGGSGLGLNVARGLARQHGGDVELVNRAEGGCRAKLTLPYSIGSTP
jgi:signal transduction histidine kinase